MTELEDLRSQVEAIKQQLLGYDEGWRKGKSLAQCVEDLRAERDMYKRRLVKYLSEHAD